MPTIFGTKLSGRLQAIDEDRELHTGEKVKFTGSYETPIGETGAYFYDQIEHDAVDEILKEFSENGVEAKYIKAAAYLKLPYPTMNHIDFEIHGVVVHESPLNWATIKKVLAIIIGLVFFTDVGYIVVIILGAWLFVGQVLPKLADYSIFLLLIGVLVIAYVFLKGAKGKVSIKH